MQANITHYVSLDLGSESTAAYYESARNPKGAMIYLQRYAARLIGTNPKYFKDENGNTLPRLKTVFYIKDNAQPDPLPDSHAELEFLDGNGNKKDYDLSLFDFFGQVGGIRTGIVLPNPKIPLQSGAEKIIPPVEPTNKLGLKINHRPLVILQHLVTQIVRNLVLGSEELKDINPRTIHLTLTMPNVYSLTHMENIRSFVEQHSGVGKVDALYESDAVAYFTFGHIRPTDPDDIRAFKRKVLRRKNKKDLRIVTIDIGRGTTDLSLIRIRGADAPAGQPDNRKHFVHGRTGKSDGGNRLSYILAGYYNKQLLDTFDKFGYLIAQSQPPFDFLVGDSPMNPYQPDVLEKLQDLIEAVKKSFKDNYSIDLSKKEQTELIAPVVDKLYDAINPQWKARNEFEEFREELYKSMILPRSLPGAWAEWFFSLPSRFSSEARERRDRLTKLKNNIIKYVENNILELVQELEKMVVAREPEGSDIWKKVFDKNCTFVLIAGRGSQFQPLEQAIYKALRNFPKQNVHFLKGTDAKEACCKGAIRFQKSQAKPMNADELHGTYGFVADSPTNEEEVFLPVSTSLLNNEEASFVNFTTIALYYFIYSTRHAPNNGEPPELQDGTTAYLNSFLGANFKVEYDKRKAEIKVNDTTVIPVPTFGDVDEDIYPKVWPEVVRPK
jgi:hypothetical protein